jgi:hypothetical protein
MLHEHENGYKIPYFVAQLNGEVVLCLIDDDTADIMHTDLDEDAKWEEEVCIMSSIQETP